MPSMPNRNCHKKIKSRPNWSKYPIRGVKKDLFKEEYQGSFDDIVAKRPTKDAEKVTATKRAKDTNLFLSIKVLYIKMS